LPTTSGWPPLSETLALPSGWLTTCTPTSEASLSIFWSRSSIRPEALTPVALASAMRWFSAAMSAV
jgi:hypothetical protein